MTATKQDGSSADAKYDAPDWASMTEAERAAEQVRIFNEHVLPRRINLYRSLAKQ